MSRAYSNRALPAGTVLREWRLEEVLGVGGFGIVYKGKGIYFNELVAIKEYFPSAISERGEDDTVVPIDSDAEEVHALGLKKFVEEAKLLWNLSTPTRHPNIVSVRSLFEIHGTAYMVMDFEDGTSLSKALKDGRRFNEASLRAIILPIAEGLERAHRVGVLHRDIKPPNIILNEDGRSVLIDFGSARFESGDATSTKVTFHTPPYAAIEQYVRTFAQGPWTDVYALGVVLYECITGTKPAEVLERMHGDAGTPLAAGSWPGFSKTFLHAVDRAMTVTPAERPQSISAWLELLEHEAEEPDEEEDSVTRIGNWDTETAHIVPVAPAKNGFSPSDGKIETRVPETPSKASFTRADRFSEEEDEEVKVEASSPEPEAEAEKTAPEPPAAEEKEERSPVNGTAPVEKKAETREGARKGPAESSRQSDKPKGDARKSRSRIGVLALAGLGALVLAGSVYFLFSGWSNDPGNAAPVMAEASTAALDEATKAELAQSAGDAGMSTGVVALLQSLDGEADPFQTLSNFISASMNEAEGRVAAHRGSRESAAALQDGLETLRADGERAITSADLAGAIAATRELVARYGALNAQLAPLPEKTALAAAETAKAGEAEGRPTATGIGSASEAAPSGPVVTASVEAAEPRSNIPVTAARRREFAAALDDARDLAREVIRLGRRDPPGSNGTDAEREAYRVRQGAADAARDYLAYLDNLENSMRGVTTDAEAAESVAKARQTRAYLSDLRRRAQLSLD